MNPILLPTLVDYRTFHYFRKHISDKPQRCTIELASKLCENAKLCIDRVDAIICEVNIIPSHPSSLISIVKLFNEVFLLSQDLFRRTQSKKFNSVNCLTEVANGTDASAREAIKELCTRGNTSITFD